MLVAYNSEATYEENNKILFHRDAYMTLFHLGELSNFFNYIVYHLIKKKYSILFTNLVKTVQLCWFSYIRVYLILLEGIKFTSVFDSKLFIVILWSIYILGVIWSCKQCMILKNNIRNSFVKYIKNK